MRSTSIIATVSIVLTTACSNHPVPQTTDVAPAPAAAPPAVAAQAPVHAPAVSEPQQDSRRHRYIDVESPGRNEKGEWKARRTLTLEGLDGYIPQGRPPTSRFGGWQERRVEATGFFRAEKIDGRWWLVDPEGCLFLSQGMNAITPFALGVREPASDGSWLAATGDLLRNASFNTAGGWSSPQFRGGAAGMARTVTMHTMESFAKSIGVIEMKQGMSHFIRDCIPVFHPGFPAFAQRTVGGLSESPDDPWILGFFSDNELPLPVDVLDRCLDLDAENPSLKPNRDAAEAWLAANVPDGDRAKITPDHRQRFVAFVAERYFAIMRDAIKERFPKHMYIGSRLLALIGHIGKNGHFWRMAGKYQDVISINYYDVWGPDRTSVTTWEGWASRPLMITEWYAKAKDIPGLSNRGGAGFLVRTQEDRANYYQHFVLTCLESRCIVGWHWFRYQDDHASAKREDNAGGANKGFVNDELKPYELLFGKAGAVQGEAYRLTGYFDAR